MDPVVMPDTVQPDLHPHWMLQEIFEQPAVLQATLNHYAYDGGLRQEPCRDICAWLDGCRNGIMIAASGSSRHAGLVAEILLEDLSGITVDVEYASEYCNRSEVATRQRGVIVISQSGETGDTLASLRKANIAGHKTLAVTNNQTSTIAREAAVSFPTLAGRERAIPATKSFTGQLLNLHLLSLLAAQSLGSIEDVQLSQRLQNLTELPSLVDRQLAGWFENTRSAAERYSDVKSLLFLGRGIHYPIAREGALKLKESAYLHAEGYPTGELKHGPNALVSRSTPLVILATVDRQDADSRRRYEKTLQLMRDMRNQDAEMIAVATSGDRDVESIADCVIFVEEATESIQSICEVVPLQLFSYFMALQNGIDVDSPRNLTKAVLTE